MDLETHDLILSEEYGDLRVVAGDGNYLMKGIKKGDFLRQYEEAWDRARLEFSPVEIGTKTIQFTSFEQRNLKRRVVLNWLYVYNVNNRRFKFLFWSLKDSQTKRDVLQAAESKCGAKSEDAIALAAHTLGMKVNRFEAWMTYDEYHLSRW